MSYVEDTALELAQLAFQEARESGDDAIIKQIDDVVGASSQGLQEAYSAFVRVLRAEERARKLLAESAARRQAPPPAG